ncbi:MAG TPA: septum formation initiator family protein [Candidatus Saccharimonadales bacterium]|nr:septum formation initiator family protein [Candidatus Saccharimonadales bacterium]
MQIQTYTNKVSDFIRKLGDTRFAGQVLFVVIVLLISWSGIKSIQTNYGLQKQISGLKQQDEVQQLQNNNLQLQNQYYNSDQYLELSARQNFGLAKPGEQEIIVPESVAMAYTVDVPSDQKTATAQPAYQHNFESWVDFFLHRQSNN